MPKLALCGGPAVRTRPSPKWPEVGAAEEQALRRALYGPYWGLHGAGEVERFEARFAEYQHARYAVAVSNGTVALRIALWTAGIQPGDEVIVPPYTFLATASAVVECNATPVFVDIDRDTMNLSPPAVAAAITPRTRAVIPVHLGGLPCDMDALGELARQHNLALIEDAAHAHGGEYKGRRLGSLGHLGCFSFQSSKNLTCGEGGAVVTSDAELYERVRAIHNCGRMPGGAWYEHQILSGNYRITEFQGALLNVQLDRLEAQVQLRERNAKLLLKRLAGLPGWRPQVRPDYPHRHGNHIFAVRYDPAVFGVTREIVLAALRAEGVPAAAGYPVPLYRQPMFVNLDFGPYRAALEQHPGLDYRGVRCPECELLCETAIWLHQNVLLGAAEDMAEIADSFQKLVEYREELRACAPLRELESA
jgi:dTDP-4-amino-4,6-dideoxygalactose transaminase